MIHLIINLYANESTILKKKILHKKQDKCEKKFVHHSYSCWSLKKDTKTVKNSFQNVFQANNKQYLFFKFKKYEWFSQSKHTHFPPSASPPCHLSRINLSFVLYQWLDPAWGICSLFCCGWRKKTNAWCGE